MTQLEATSSNSSDPELPRWVGEVFSRFASFYGHVWRSQFKDAWFLEFSKKEWFEGLRQFGEEIIGKATLSCRDAYEMPPTLPQMVIICKQIKKSHMFMQRNNNEKLHASREIARLHLQSCKVILSKS